MADQTAAQKAEGPLAETETGGNKPREVLTLDTLPNEIMWLITVTLAVDIYAPYRTSEDLQQTSRDRQMEDIDARQNLTNLCMVSKQMAANAQKALYRNVLITNADTLILFYRTLLENPKLGIQIKRMTLNIHHPVGGIHENTADHLAWEDYPIDLGPILSGTQHGLGEHLTTAVEGSRYRTHQALIEILYTLQFGVLGRTSHLESLDLNVHPVGFPRKAYMTYQMDDIHSRAVNGALLSMWKEASRCLMGLKNLHLIGKETPHSSEESRSGFVALIIERFLTLPKLERLIWFNHADGWFDNLSNRTVPGSDDHSQVGTELRYGSIRSLKLKESSCFPRDLVAICSAFPNLESLSVDTNSRQCNEKLTSVYRPPRYYGNADPNSGMGTKYLTDSLAGLKNLTALSLDLHYACNISRTLGESGTLSLADLPNLQTLAVPFHFFLRKKPEGRHEVVSPVSILPRGLRTLRIVACFGCITFRFGEDFDDEFAVYQHRDSVLQLLEGLANLRSEYFPRLRRFSYQESTRAGIRRCYESQTEIDPLEGHYAIATCPFHFHTESDISSFHAVSLKLFQCGVVVEKDAKWFQCGVY